MTSKKQQPEASIKVMLVDDDPMIRRLITKHLQREGYNINAFENAEDGLAFFKENPRYERFGEARPLIVVPLMVTAVASLVLGFAPDFGLHLWELARATAQAVTG